MDSLIFEHGVQTGNMEEIIRALSAKLYRIDPVNPVDWPTDAPEPPPTYLGQNGPLHLHLGFDGELMIRMHADVDTADACTQAALHSLSPASGDPDMNHVSITEVISGRTIQRGTAPPPGWRPGPMVAPAQIPPHVREAMRRIMPPEVLRMLGLDQGEPPTGQYL